MGVHAIDYPLPHTRSGSGSRSFHKKPESVLLMDISVLFRKRHMSEFDLSFIEFCKTWVTKFAFGLWLGILFRNCGWESSTEYH